MRILFVGLFLGLVAPTVRAEDKDAKPATPAEAAKLVNKKCTVVMVISSTGEARGKRFIFLNSEENFRDKNNFTLVIEKKTLAKFKKAKIDNPAAHFKGKKVQVTGTVTLYNKKPQIKVEDPGQIKIVEEKGNKKP
jgi:DNA/RNA endonuclease YhcR with UshA esterase domain